MEPCKTTNHDIITKCLAECDRAREEIGGAFSRLSFFGEALAQLAAAYQSIGDLKMAMGTYKKSRAVFYMAACLKPSCYRRMQEVEVIIESLTQEQM